MMKNRKMLSALLATTIFCTMLPPVPAIAEEGGEAVNVQPVVEEVTPAPFNAKSGEEIAIEGGKEGVDYEWAGNVLVIKTSKILSLTSSLEGRIYTCSVRVDPGVQATLKLKNIYVELAETGDAIPETSTLTLTGDAGDSSQGCYLHNYQGTLKINGNGYFLVDNGDRESLNCGNLEVNSQDDVNFIVDQDWWFKNFVIKNGDVQFNYHDSNYSWNRIYTENFIVHSGNVAFNLGDVDSPQAVVSNNCTIDGGSLAVYDRVETESQSFYGIVGADAELENTSRNYQYNSLIQADSYTITGGIFYQADLSTNTVYGCPVATNRTIVVEDGLSNDPYGSQYAKYVVTGSGSDSKLGVNGSNYEWSGRVLVLNDGANVTVSSVGMTSDRILVAEGANATLHLNGVNMRNTMPAIMLGYTSTLTLVLDGGDNSVETIGQLGQAAIETSGGSNLIIRGTGSLHAQGTEGGAGIGSGEEIDNSSKYAVIKIESGNITAQGGAQAAGIGGGLEHSEMDIEITGGTIEASGASGIGDGPHSRYTNILIKGGVITAKGNSGAGIGGGPGSTVDRIEIDDGVINAYSSSGAGIGSGAGYYSYDDGKTYNATVDRITINGGDIYANGSAGIGGGRTMNGALTSVGRIDILGGTVEAYGNYGNAYGIGAGQGGIGGTLSCDGAVIIADSISDMAHQENWHGLFFVDTINHGQGTLMGDYVTLSNNYDNDRYIEIKENQSLNISEGVVFNNRGSIDIQSDGSLFNEGILNNEGSITVFSGGTFNNSGAFNGNEVVYIDEEPQPTPDDTVVTGV